MDMTKTEKKILFDDVLSEMDEQIMQVCKKDKSHMKKLSEDTKDQ